MLNNSPAINSVSRHRIRTTAKQTVSMKTYASAMFERESHSFENESSVSMCDGERFKKVKFSLNKIRFSL